MRYNASKNAVKPMIQRFLVILEKWNLNFFSYLELILSYFELANMDGH